MNTTKIQALYPFFCDCLRTKAAQPQRCLLDMMEIKLIADQMLEGSRRFSVAVRDQANPVKRFDLLGFATDELLHEIVPARTWAWAGQQLPADPDDEMRWAIERTGLLVRLHAHTPLSGQPGQLVPEVEPSVWLPRQASATEVAPLLRGLRAFQAKRRKRARRLVAQLRAYHAAQLPSSLPFVALAATEPIAAVMCESPTMGLAPRLYGKLRRGLAAKVHQVAVAAEAMLGEGAQVA